MLRLHFLQHVPFETPGHILAWAAARGHTVAGTRLFAGEPLPRPATYDWLVVMGGPMGVHDDAPFAWLAQEKRALQDALGADRVVIGICLGAQLLAQALGARVYPNRTREIGWFPISKTPDAARAHALDVLPDMLDVFHWHGDTFDIPAGALHALQSDACRNQAFVHGGRRYGLQFHLETTEAGARDLIANCGHELVPAPYVQAAGALLAEPARFAATHRALERLLDAIAEGC